MAKVNKYANRSKISEAKFRQFLKLFSFDLDASQIALVTGLNRNTVNRYLMALRQRIAEYCERQAPGLGEIEVDESHFGPRRVKGLRGRGASSKTIVFGILKRQGQVIPRSCLIVAAPRFRQLSEVESASKASSIPMDGVAITAWLI